MNFHPVTDNQAEQAYEAADFLLELPIHLDFELRTKLDTFRADVGVELEDRGRCDLVARRAAKRARQP
jgi:hypothetical protein